MSDDESYLDDSYYGSDAATPRRPGKMDIDSPMDDDEIENRWQKKTQVEHALLRPDMYIGSIVKRENEQFIYTIERGLEFRNVEYCPGLYKIFDEILVNASDHKQRSPDLSTIKVDIDKETGWISIENDGEGIPIAIHRKEGVWLPELIFGHMLTSSNYDDDEEKTTGGRNGLGAKVTNIYSTQFVVETSHRGSKKTYRQEWMNNMQDCEEPEIEEFKSTRKMKKDYTRISFLPDYERFGMPDGLEEGTYGIMMRRALDIAGCNDGVTVILNGETLPVSNFREYIEFYQPLMKPDFDASSAPKSRRYKGEGGWYVYTSCENWEVAFAVNPFDTCNQVSFVNSIHTLAGGQHVNHVFTKLWPVLKTAAEKKLGKRKEFMPSRAVVSTQLFMFIRCLVVNPGFDSQTKEKMTTDARKFKFLFDLGATTVASKLAGKILRLGLMDRITRMASVKDQKALKKTDGKKSRKIRGIEKLDDANWAGTSKSHKCTLILTEGDSAKPLAIAGLSVVGRNEYGVYPLRGKLLNVRSSTPDKIAKCACLNDLKQILGLKQQQEYTDTKSLRYGHLMIMCDQDPDGSHIKGLIINWLQYFWPSLLQIRGFLQEFVTPIVKVRKGPSVKSFFTLNEFQTYIEEQPGKVDIKYYKGLGTSTPAEGREYFRAIGDHVITFSYSNLDADPLDLAFSGSRTDERKTWLRNIDFSQYVDHTKRSLKVRDFVHKELIFFSHANVERSIPSVIDGFKPGQRKVLFSCFKRNLNKDIKVAQLIGYISEQSAYHHGEGALATTIVGMAQDFVGSNNIPLLVPSGIFGSRMAGGSDHASERYINTHLQSITRLIFPKADDPLLNYLEDDGLSIEPEYYIPIIPMVLVNGAHGIGTGWSTSVPCYHPVQLVENIKDLMKGREQRPIAPWYRGFKGEIEPAISISPKGRRTTKPGRFTSWGQIETVDEASDKIVLSIFELPVGLWNDKLKEKLATMEDYNELLKSKAKSKAKSKSKSKSKKGDDSESSKGSKSVSLPILSFADQSTDREVHIDVELEPAVHSSIGNQERAVERAFGLSSSIALTNMMLRDKNGRVKKYNSPEEIIQEFFNVRLALYRKRHIHLIDELMFEVDRLTNKHRFLEMVLSDQIQLSRRPKQEICQELFENNFIGLRGGSRIEITGNLFSKKGWKAASQDQKHAYDYLLEQNFLALTEEKLSEFEKQIDLKQSQLADICAKTPENLWESDLDAFVKAWEVWQLENTATVTEIPERPVESLPGAGASIKIEPAVKSLTPPAGSSRKRTAAQRAEAALQALEDSFSDFESLMASTSKSSIKKATTEGPSKKKAKTSPKLKELDELDYQPTKIETTPAKPKRLVSKRAKKSTRKPLTPKPASPKPVFDESESDDGYDEGSVEDTPSMKPLPTRQRASRRSTRMKVSYDYDDEFEDEYDNEYDSETEESDDYDEDASWVPSD